MSHPAPTRQDHERFCEIEGWQLVRNATGKRGHHVTYELTLPSGDVLRTRISHPPDRTTYGARIWAHILRDQLKVSDQEFWKALATTSPPLRGGTDEDAPGDPIPAGVVWQLRNKVGVPEVELRGMKAAEAVERLNRYYTEETGPPE